MNQAAVPASGGSVAGKTSGNVIDGNGQSLQRDGSINDRGSLLVATVTDKRNDQASSVSSIYRLLQGPDDANANTTTTITPPPSNRPEPASATLVTGNENGSILVLPSLANSTAGYYRTTTASTGGETSSNNNSSGDENNSVPPLPVKATRLYSLPAALNSNTVNVPIKNGINSMNSLPAIRHTLLQLPRNSSNVSSGVSSQSQATYPPPAPLRSFQLQPQSQLQSQSQILLSSLKNLIPNRPGSFSELMTTNIQDSRQQPLITTTNTNTTTVSPPVPTTPTLHPQTTDSDYFHRITPSKQATKPHSQTKHTSQTTIATVSRRNAQELTAKSIAIKYIDHPISEYAQIVRAAEEAVTKTESTHSTKAHIQAAEQTRERERQVYALLWLMKHCEAKHDSYVPRGRIYALYAASCSTFGLRPLSQASLGKLIRILFPDLTTRRLGTRGQSKYHYCGLRLVSADLEDGEDNNNNNNNVDVEGRSSGAEACVGGSGSSVTTPDAGSPSTNTGSVMSREKRPAKEEKGETEVENKKKRLKLSSGNTLHETAVTVDSDNNCKSAIESECKFKARTVEAEASSCKCEFPFLANLLSEIFQNEKILSTDYKLEFPCVPRDIKIVGDKQVSTIELDNSLTALESQYHGYRNKLFKSIISLDLESLSETLASPSWLESVPPQVLDTLFESSEFTDWIQKCDMVTYTSSIKYLSNLVVSDKLATLSSSGSPLPSLESYFQGFQDRATKAISDLPQPFSKLKTVKLQTLRAFMALVKKLLKLAKFIMNFLNSFATFKDGMRNDWETIVNLDDILEMVIATARYKEIMPLIRDFMRLNLESLLQIDEDSHEDKETEKTENQRPRDISSFNSTVTKLLEYISSPQVRQWPAYIFIDSYVRFTNAMVGDISLKSSENLLPWLFYNNVTTQLITYSFEVTKFVT